MIMNRKCMAALVILLLGGSLFLMGGCATTQTGGIETPVSRKSPWSHPVVW
jgi:hypothetical protein